MLTGDNISSANDDYYRQLKIERKPIPKVFTPDGQKEFEEGRNAFLRSDIEAKIKAKGILLNVTKREGAKVNVYNNQNAADDELVEPSQPKKILHRKIGNIRTYEGIPSMKDTELSLAVTTKMWHSSKNKKFKNKHEMRTADNLICCINSLHYLKDNKFDYIIIDEIETVNNKWFDNETLSTTDETRERSLEAWKIYINLLKQAERVFLLDAFLTNTTLKFIESIEPNNYIIFKKKVEVSDRKIVVIPEHKQWQANIISQIKDGVQLTEYNKKCMTIVLPDKGINPPNPNALLARIAGCQMVAMRFQLVDNFLLENTLFFDRSKYAFSLKPEEQRYKEVTIPTPTPQNPAYSYATRTTSTDYYSFNV
jgi:hypothetical protein